MYATHIGPQKEDKEARAIDYTSVYSYTILYICVFIYTINLYIHI